MAVNIIKEHKGIKEANIIEHHRNPSGQHNKVKWLLEQSHRDINKIHEIVSKIVMSGYDMISSWIVAETMAIDIAKYGFKDRHEYISALINRKIYKWRWWIEKHKLEKSEKEDEHKITEAEYIKYHDERDSAERCYECGGYDDDYGFDENGEMISNCTNCSFNFRANDFD